MKTEPTPDMLRAHYAKTTLARMGVPFETGIQIEAVRIVVDGAAKAQERRRMASLNQIAAA